MTPCDITLSAFTATDGTLDVSTKYKELMATTLDEDSLYERAKVTFFRLFEELSITEKERAEITAQNISNLMSQTSAAAMQSALQWAVAERDGAYANASTKAQTELLIAQTAKTKEEICLTNKQSGLVCAQTKATTAQSIRENGRIASLNADGCTVESLQPEGLKYAQEKLIDGQKYQTLAEAYRKAGVVTIGADADGITKGTTGDAYGYHHEQIGFTNRQTKSFEDSKRNHAANSAAQMIGQLLSAETPPEVQDITRWRNAMDYLLTATV